MYDYSTQHKSGQDHSNADMLNRLPLSESATDLPTPVENTLVLNMLESLPVASREILRWMDKDSVLSKVSGAGWLAFVCSSPPYSILRTQTCG